MPRTVLAVAVCVVVAACRGEVEHAGTVAPTPVPKPVVAARTAADARVAPPGAPATQILFGDLHVHTTFSLDAFMRTLPFMQGEGAHPPADACDFARYCSALDFWAITDHSEGITPRQWQETKDSIRQCNAVAGDPSNPDLVAFTGWEWTQVGTTPANHWGHKNVIFKDTADDRLPKRPISARNELTTLAFNRRPPLLQRLIFPFRDWEHRQRYFDFGALQEEVIGVPMCPEGVPERDLPADCHEAAPTPPELFAKLDAWGFDAMVIPHGTTWGFYTPAGSTLDKQLVGKNHDPNRQFLFEIYSGHGNSEEWRPYTAGYLDADGKAVCPAPTKDFLPCCWQAGEIIRSRCTDRSSAECEKNVEDARRLYIQGGVQGFRAIPGTTPADWLDCDQCRDCFLPAFKLRPGNSGQYALAIKNFDDPAHPREFRFGFIASSDNHSARPGTGYKEFARRSMTETIGPKDETWLKRIDVDEPPAPRARPVEELGNLQAFQLLETERQGSFFFTGGLVAVHAATRTRDAIWDALHRRAVYATSGDRILLWFDLLNPPSGGTLPMGSDVTLGTAPRFRVRAAGAFVQKPGCPAHALSALGADRVNAICRGECYNPGDARRRITRIEIVRIRPQVRAGEPVAGLIDDPWKRLDCPADPAGCTVEFDDPDFVAGGREIAYYVRAIQEPTPAVNGGTLRCERDATGQCVRVHPCYGDFRTPFDDDCLAPVEERAWSSPIWVRPTGGA